MTRLRISAHDLEIETGRYLNKLRDERTCKWCQNFKNVDITESEEHFLYDCDSYLENRRGLIENLTNVPCDTETGRLISTNTNINISSIKQIFMNLISSHTTDHFDDSDILTMHFKRLHPAHEHFQAFNHLRSYISNTACAYVNRCFEKRNEYHGELEASATVINTIDIRIIRDF